TRPGPVARKRGDRGSSGRPLASARHARPGAGWRFPALRRRGRAFLPQPGGDTVPRAVAAVRDAGRARGPPRRPPSAPALARPAALAASPVRAAPPAPVVAPLWSHWRPGGAACLGRRAAGPRVTPANAPIRSPP